MRKVDLLKCQIFKKGYLSPLWLLAIYESLRKMQGKDLTDPDNNEMIY
jgi:hypothetical protein